MHGPCAARRPHDTRTMLKALLELEFYHQSTIRRLRISATTTSISRVTRSRTLLTLTHSKARDYSWSSYPDNGVNGH
eukprot:scaffold81_cov115-Isochrysis_galbana.AAC.5